MTLTLRTRQFPDDVVLEDWFGSVGKSMLGFFQIMTTEGWADIARHLFDKDMSLVFIIILYMTITTFAFMNVVVAVVVEKTLDVFRAADVDGDGFLTKEEFLEAMRVPSVLRRLHEVDINVADVEGLFDILDHDESGELTPEEFIDGCVRARGEARNKEV